jgi:hypothetical protein
MHIPIETNIHFNDEAIAIIKGYLGSRNAPTDDIDETFLEDFNFALVYHIDHLVQAGLRNLTYYVNERIRTRASICLGFNYKRDALQFDLKCNGLLVKVLIEASGALTVQAKQRRGGFGIASSNTWTIEKLVEKALTDFDTPAPDYNNHSPEQA